MKGIILAAGMGIRLRPLTNELPKAFIKINNFTLIERALGLLNSVGIKEIIIVVGFMENFFKNSLGNDYKGTKLIYVSNKEFASTGSMYSLSKIKGIIDDDVLLLESDLLFEKKALIRLINSSSPDVILVSPISGSGDEVYICINENNELTNLGKDIFNRDKSIGELVGISKLSINFIMKLFEKANEEFEKTNKHDDYEEMIYKLSQSYPIKCVLIDDLNWIEIDNIEDLKRAREVIYPKISRSEII